MQFKVGDKVVHRVHGPGEITALEEKELMGRTAMYYVVELVDMLMWVPVDPNENASLRPLADPEEFDHLIDILRSPAVPLPDDRMARRMLLSSAIQDGDLEATCRIIRDLSRQSKHRRLSDYDSSVLERARYLFLNEWTLSSSFSIDEADQALEQALAEGSANLSE